LRREVHYNSFHPLRKALLLYLISFVAMLASSIFRGSGLHPRPVAVENRSHSAPLPPQLFYWIGIGAFFAGVVAHGYAFWLRYMISGRAPVTNMYESVIWVGFGAALFALILELASRERYFILGAAPLSIVLLLLADQFPAVLDPSIGPLMPVLRNNWLIWVHVPTITLGYAAFALTLGVGHIALGYYLFAPRAKATIAKLETLIYRAMQIGVLMIAAGTILGGIWAHYAWGRFWGWDPKETWALITLLCYLVPLHGRLAGWMSNFSLTVASIVCFLPVLMAWYGVNFILGKGLHSYGFGVGGYWYAVAFVFAELALVGIASWRRNHAAAPEPARQPVSAAFGSHS
jgi:ABC-type transport system involved in cytochrome c biogenesis permease subunit